MEPTFDALHWTFLGMIALLTVSLLLTLQSHRELDRRVTTRDEASPSPSELHTAIAETRRAHVRLDNQERQLQAFARELGWSDNHTKTKVLGSPPSSPPPLGP